jgi:predicted NBD/HSP70 family sugar kinase
MRGITGSAGEIGYNELGYWLKSKKNFSLLFDNQRDFGDIISEPVLINAAERAIKKGYESILSKNNPITINSIGKAAESGDKLACNLLKEMGALIGIVCINLLNTVNPEMIILCGQIIEKCPMLVKLVQQNVHKDILHSPAEAVQICASKLKDEAVLKGAISMVLHDWLEMPVNRIYPF